MTWQRILLFVSSSSPVVGRSHPGPGALLDALDVPTEGELVAGAEELHPGKRQTVTTFLEINCLFYGTSIALVTDVEAGLSPTAGLLGVSEGLVMDKGGMHVVPGTGQVGSALAAHLAGLGVAVRAVSRHRPATMSGGADWRVADITDPEADAGAAQGPLAVYQCVGAPYTRWPELFPPLRLAGAAWRSGERRTSSARASPGGQLLSRPLG